MDEEDDNLWIQDQIRKGGGVGVPAPPPRNSAAGHAAAWQSHPPGGYPSGGRVSMADAAVVALSGEAALAALQQNFQRLKVSSPLTFMRCSDFRPLARLINMGKWREGPLYPHQRARSSTSIRDFV